MPAHDDYRASPAAMNRQHARSGRCAVPLHTTRAQSSGVAPIIRAKATHAAAADLAWWAAAEAARYAGLGDAPDIAASLSARALTPDAALRARQSQLDDGEHRALWLALHRATNPDPVTAVMETVDAARYVAGPHAANLIADARTRIDEPPSR
jgi:hypothetical protein